MVKVSARAITIFGSAILLIVSSFISIFAFDSPSGPVPSILFFCFLGITISAWGSLCAINPQGANNIAVRYEIPYSDELVSITVYILALIYLFLMSGLIWARYTDYAF